jgi:hypothetical protein
VLQVNISEIVRKPQVCNQILQISELVAELQANIEQGRTIGSCGIGRAEISTNVSEPIPGALRVQATSLFAIQVMYFIKN